MNPLFSFLRKQPNINVDPKKVADILTRGVEDVFVKESLEKKLLSGKQLRVKLGIDPTSAKIHLGRAITLRKLKAFQDLGHQLVLIVGDFTALVGRSFRQARQAPDAHAGKDPRKSPRLQKADWQDHRRQPYGICVQQ